MYQTSVKPSIKALPCSAAAKCHFKAASVSWGTPSWPSSSISANASPNTTNPQELGVYGLHTANSNLPTVATCVNKHLETSCSMPPSSHQNKEANSPNPGTFCAWAFPFSAAKVYHFWASPCSWKDIHHKKQQVLLFPAHILLNKDGSALGWWYIYILYIYMPRISDCH